MAVPRASGWRVSGWRIPAVLAVIVAAAAWGPPGRAPVAEAQTATAPEAAPTTEPAGSAAVVAGDEGVPLVGTVSAPAMPSGGFSGVTPVRAFDSRESADGPCVGSVPRTVSLAGRFGIPANASAVALNVTAVWPSAAGFVTVWPAGRAQPLVSNLNFSAGQVVPNMVTVALGDGGAINLYTNAGCPNLIVDVAGWYAGGTPVAPGGFSGITPVRAFDSRESADGPCVGSVPRTVSLAGRFGIPATASAVALNVTAVNPTAEGFVTVSPSGQPRPLASNLNFRAGQVVPNMVTVALGTGGAIDLYTNAGCPDLIVDVAGWYAGGQSSIVPPATADLAVSDGHSCALLYNGTVRCWGWNVSGQLGDGTTTDRPQATAVVGLSDATRIATGRYHSCAVVTGGAVRCWGANHRGQLGDGTTTNRPTPVAVTSLSGAVAVAVGNEHTCAVLSGGSVRCWGANDDGELGDGTTADRWTPVTVTGLAGATFVEAGVDFTCALVTGGTARCWGSNRSGQLGDNSGVSRTSPVPVSGLTGATSISLGGRTACALITGGVLGPGTARCWGSNVDGQVGDGTSGNARLLPVAVSGLNEVGSIAVGLDHTCATSIVGAVYCWGRNGLGQVGDGTTVSPRVSPTRVNGLSSATQLATGGNHTCVSASWNVRCWGLNDTSQLADGTTTNRTTPVAVTGWGVTLGLAPVEGGFTGITPVRALDTREPGQGPCVSTPRALPLAGRFGIPADAAAVALNVTAVWPSAAGFVTASPSGESVPLVSNLNYLAGQVVPNMVTVALGGDGAVSLSTNAGCPHLVVDVAGWYKAPPPVTATLTADARAGISTTAPLPSGLTSVSDLSGSIAGVAVSESAGGTALDVAPARTTSTGPKTGTFTGRACAGDVCRRALSLTLTTNVAAATAPAGTLVPATPSPDRVQATATGDIAGAELVAILGPPDAPGTRAQAQTVASSVGATLIGGSESLGAYQLLYPPGTNLDTAKTTLATKPGVTAAVINEDAPVDPEAIPNDWSDDGPAQRWPWEMINAPAAWDSATGSTTKVGILDLGMYPGHEDLHVTQTISAVTHDVHGTHVAGLACARGNNGKGLTGAAWGCPIVYTQAANDSSSWYSYLQWAWSLAALRDSGARVVNASLGTNAPDGCADPTWSQSQSASRPVDVFFEVLFQQPASQQVVWTTSAGNNCSPYAEHGLKRIGSKYPNVLVVAAVNSDNTLARFSNSGSWVDIAAPGGVHTPTQQGVWSTTSSCVVLACSSRYGASSGTSMAAPIVAGVAALVREQHPTYSATQVADCIRQSGPRGGKKVSPRSSLPAGDAPKQNEDITNLYTVDATMAVSCDDLATVVGCTNPCQITGVIPFTHPSWGVSQLVTLAYGSTYPSACSGIKVVGADRRVRWAYDSFRMCPGTTGYLRPGSPSGIDATGNLFLDYNAGRYNGVIVLRPTATGFEDFGTLPAADSYDGRFYFASAVDGEGDGRIEIDASYTDCYPSCALAPIHTVRHRWTGADYRSEPPFGLMAQGIAAVVERGTGEAAAKSALAAQFGPPTRAWSSPGPGCSSGDYVEYGGGDLVVVFRGGVLDGYQVRSNSVNGKAVQTAAGFRVGDPALAVAAGTPGASISGSGDQITISYGLVATFAPPLSSAVVTSVVYQMGCA